MSKRTIRILGPIVMIAVGILLTEIALRIVPSPIRSAPIHEFDDTDSLLGVEMVPGARSSVRESFRRLKNHMNPDQQLLVFAFPDVLQIGEDPAALVRLEYGVAPPTTFNPRASYDRLSTILQEEHITAIETLPSLLAVRAREGLEYPYFMHTCDGHYSAYGLRTLAEILAPHLTPLLNRD